VVAAREAGFDKVTLLEEPQAAFYAYLAARVGRARRTCERARAPFDFDRVVNQYVSLYEGLT
jgi:hypothetical protein